MRLTALVLAVFSLAACASSVPPVPETGAFSVKYVMIDGDYFVRIDKVGVNRVLIKSEENHLNRRDYKRTDWETYASRLFPQDEINFNTLRQLRGSNLVPVGLASPTPSAVPPCDETANPVYAKEQSRVIRRAPRSQPGDSITMVSTCLLHKGLTASQYSGIHQRPNPYRFPTRYEVIVDLDRNGTPEQRNVRIRNVSKATVGQFLRSETIVPRDEVTSLMLGLDRL
ncbi:MAG: hypothetical protein AAFR65_01645 [Pseudomonadota bacterium]